MNKKRTGMQKKKRKKSYNIQKTNNKMSKVN